MSSQSWNAIPEARRKALAARQRKQEEWSDGEDDELERPPPMKSTEWSGSGSGSGSGSISSSDATKKKSISSSLSQEMDVEKDLFKQHGTKLERLEERIERLVTLNENLAERSKQLEDLVVQVAESVGVPHGFRGSSK